MQCCLEIEYLKTKGTMIEYLKTKGTMITAFFVFVLIFIPYILLYMGVSILSLLLSVLYALLINPIYWLVVVLIFIFRKNNS